MLDNAAHFYFLGARVSVSRNFLDSSEAERRMEQNGGRGKGSWKNIFFLCLFVSTPGGEPRVPTPGLASPPSDGVLRQLTGFDCL